MQETLRWSGVISSFLLEPALSWQLSNRSFLVYIPLSSTAPGSVGHDRRRVLASALVAPIPMKTGVGYRHQQVGTCTMLLAA